MKTLASSPKRQSSAGGVIRPSSLLRLTVAAMLGFVASPGTVAAAETRTQSAAKHVDMAPDYTAIRYKTVSVNGIKIFYREAGDAGKPTILLLHGFPSSSSEFRTLLPLLSRQFHVVAPDYPGFGFSDAPDAKTFTPTFANLTSVMEGFVQTVGLTKFAIFMHDFSGPVGFRFTVAHPEMVRGLIIQKCQRL